MRHSTTGEMHVLNSIVFGEAGAACPGLLEENYTEDARSAQCHRVGNPPSC